jgi:hypothetical protein
MIAKQFQYPSSPLRLTIGQYGQATRESNVTKVRLITLRVCPVKPIEISGDVEQLRPMLKKVRIDDLRPRLRAGKGSVTHSSILAQMR